MHCRQYMGSLRSFIGAPFCALCVLVATALARRVVLLDDTFVAFEHSNASVEVNVSPFVLGGNFLTRYIPCRGDILCRSRNVYTVPLSSSLYR
jgi:hypothetical protein